MNRDRIGCEMQNEVSCVIYTNVYPHIKYIYLTKPKTAGHWTDPFCLWRECVVHWRREHWGSAPRQADCQLQSDLDSDRAVRGSVSEWNLMPSEMQQSSKNCKVFMLYKFNSTYNRSLCFKYQKQKKLKIKHFSWWYNRKPSKCQLDQITVDIAESVSGSTNFGKQIFKNFC